MLQAPSHLSRVCGHGHIKKFWLMQTQKESQACESKGSVVVSSFSSSRHANRASMKGFDSSQWSPPSPAAPSSGCGDAGAETGKHSSFTCAASLRPHSCKAVPPLLPFSSVPNGGIEDMDAEEDNYTRRDGGDSLGRAPAKDAHPSTSLSRSCSPNVASELESKRCHESALVSSEADQEESLLSEGCHRDNDVMSTSMKESPASNADKGHPHHIQHDGKGSSPAAESMITDTHIKIKACSSPAHGMGTVCVDDREMLGDGKLSPSHRRSLMCSHVSESVPEKGKSSEATAESRTCYSYGDRLPQVAYVVQHPDLKACSLCGTTKTPMWRSGPEGPKSLCNACGIRFKKYRSFPGQSETCDLMMSPLVSPTSSKSLARPLKRKQNFLPSTSEPSMPEKMGIKSAVADAVSRQQKKSKWHQLVVKRDRGELKHKLNGGSSVTWNLHSGPPSLKKIYGYSPIQTKFKNLAPMDEHRTVSRVFAKDEEEAAVLLMHLSCGLVY